jgi:branched-chain amino acid transport system ATP-binding protein
MTVGQLDVRPDGAAPSGPVIAARHLSKSFGGIRAVADCSLTVERGQILGLIGPNGAGKTTLFNILAGFMAPDSGRVELNGEDVTGRRPHELFRRGLVRTFQIAHELARMTVLENLTVVPPGQSGEHLLTALFRPARVAAEERELRERAEDVLGRLKLGELRFELAGNLSGGQKKLLELGRAMMANPKVVLLDEIGAGVNRSLMAELASYIERLNREQGYSFCIIEHDMDLIARLCDPVVVMAEGRVLTQGSMAEIRANEEVIEAYLGGRTMV